MTLIPISKVLNHFEYIQCTSATKDALGDGIKDAVGDFSSGPVASGLANLAASVLSKLLGGASGTRILKTT